MPPRRGWGFESAREWTRSTSAQLWMYSFTFCCVRRPATVSAPQPGRRLGEGTPAARTRFALTMTAQRTCRVSLRMYGYTLCILSPYKSLQVSEMHRNGITEATLVGACTDSYSGRKTLTPAVLAPRGSMSRPSTLRPPPTPWEWVHNLPRLPLRAAPATGLGLGAPRPSSRSTECTS